MCLCKDEIRFRVFDGWSPDHPVIAGISELKVGDSTLAEDKVVWSIFFWAVNEAAAVVPVVAETAMTRQVNREDVARFVELASVPVVEVVLRAPLEALVERYSSRQASATAHRIYRTFPPGSEHRLLSSPYEALLDSDRVVEVDAMDPGGVDVQDVASRVQSIVRRLWSELE